MHVSFTKFALGALSAMQFIQRAYLELKEFVERKTVGLTVPEPSISGEPANPSLSFYDIKNQSPMRRNIHEENLQISQQAVSNDLQDPQL